MNTRYLVHRVVTSVLVLFGAAALVFAAVRSVPGDPVSLMLGRADLTNPELVANFRQAYGLDESVLVQYVAWIGHVLTGDLGRSLTSNEPVADLVLRRAGATFLLGIAAAVLSMFVGISWGLAAAYLSGVGGRMVRALPMLLMSVPAYAVGLALGFILAAWLRVLPSSGMVSPVGGGGFVDVLRHSILPAVTLAIFPAALTARITYGTIDEMRNEEFVRTARAAGLSKRRVLVRHILPNALLPVITNGGVLVGGMFTSAVFVETVFGWPGIGTMMVSAVESRDYPTLQAGALIVAAVFLVVNLIVDLLYAMIDPRIRVHAGAAS